MSADQDQTFVRTFLIVLGVLVAFTFGIIWVSRLLVDITGDQVMSLRQTARVEQQTAPVFEVVTDPSALQKVSATGQGGDSGTAGAEGEPKSGEQVYQSNCAACHDAGVAGAPKMGDKDVWSTRLKEGKETLYTNAINGLNAMPAKGGDPSLSDAEVKKAVDYMLEQTGL